MAAVELDIQEGVANVVLNRPDAMNTMALELVKGVMDVAHRLYAEPGVRAVLIRGEGRTYSAGGDLREMAAADDLSHALKTITTYLHAGLSTLVRLDAPVISAVHGSAAGAGFSLICASDFVVAAESAKFTMAYTAAGLVPDGSGTFFLPRIVGLHRSLELALLNPVLGADEAKGLGLVHKVVPDDQLLDEAGALAAKLAAGPTKAYGAAKRLLRGSFSETLETQMELESLEMGAIGRTHDGPEGIRAFLEKRKPDFRGD